MRSALGADLIFDVILVKVRLRMIHNKYNDWFARIRSFLMASSAAILFLSSGLVQADLEEEEGAELAWKYHCITCHGEDGLADSTRYPNIGGQNQMYLVSRLKYFRDGKEAGNQMNAQAVLLSDEVIEKLATHFSKKSY